MIETRIARRYAQAIFSIAEENNAVDTYLAQLDDVVQTLFGNEELAGVFNNRLTKTEKKKELINKLFKGSLDKDVMNFIQLVLDKGRGGYLIDILANYQQMTDERQNVCAVTVISATPLEPDQEDALSRQLKNTINSDVRLTKKLDQALLGGFKVVIGDLHYDASVAGQLAVLKQQLVR